MSAEKPAFSIVSRRSPGAEHFAVDQEHPLHQVLAGRHVGGQIDRGAEQPLVDELDHARLQLVQRVAFPVAVQGGAELVRIARRVEPDCLEQQALRA